MDMLYRDFEERDFSALRDMMFGLYEEDPEGLPLDDAKITKTVSEFAAHPEKIRIIMICSGENVAGYALLVFYWSNEYGGDILNIDELYIKKEYRSRSIATDFVRHLMRTYNAVAAIAVEATPSNAAAARLYNRLGFEPSQNNHLILPRP